MSNDHESSLTETSFQRFSFISLAAFHLKLSIHSNEAFKERFISRRNGSISDEDYISS